MKNRIALCCLLLAVIMLVSSCGPAETQPTPTPEGDIRIYCPPEMTNPMIGKFLELHPDFRYKFTAEGLTSMAYSASYLDGMLESEYGPDIYLVPPWDAIKYTQGDMSGYAMPYEELGIDVRSGIAAADIFQYIVDIGTRPSDGAIVGLSFQSAAGAFFYRRSIAKEVWGTDDPTVIQTKIGPGWDKFFKAAEDLKKRGYCIVSEKNDILCALRNNAGQGWIKDGKLFIDEAYLDYSKEIIDNGYSIDTAEWTTSPPEKPAFGSIGSGVNVSLIADRYGAELDENGKSIDWAVCEPPDGFFLGGIWVLANKKLADDPTKKAAVTELVNWLTLQCDKDSFQYFWANGMLEIPYIMKDTVASGTVMEMIDGKMDLLGGQNMYDALIPAIQQIDVVNMTEYDAAINKIWGKHVGDYADGECTRGEAIAGIKKEVKEQLGFDAW